MAVSRSPTDIALPTPPGTGLRTPPGALSLKDPNSRNATRKANTKGRSWARVPWTLYVSISILAVWQFLIGPRVHFPTHVQLRHMRAAHSPSHPSLASLFGLSVPPPQRYAYVTLLCDEVMADATLVLVHSLKRTGTPHDIVVLTLRVSNQTTASLQKLGATTIPILTPVPYPFAVTASRLAMNKPCRYSKLLIWDMVQYTKVVFLDSDLLVIASIDDLFLRRQLSAVPDSLPPDRFNSGVMVVEPDRAVFRDMVAKVASTASPNVGDQGFLNSYFAEWYRSSTEHHLACAYNSLVRVSGEAPWGKLVEPSMKVVHFSGESKPWNLMVDKQFPTSRLMDGLWWEWHESTMVALHRTSSPSPNPTPIPSNLAPSCTKHYMAYTRGHLIRDKLSVVVNCFDRFDLLTYMVRRYATLDIVHKIYVVWGNPNHPPFRPSLFNVSVEVEILSSGVDSLNDRFRPIESLQTEAVVICDDDVEVDLAALRTAFQSWRENPYRLVGFFPRAHYRDPNTTRLSYVFDPQHEYSIVLTKMFIAHAEYLRRYTCTAPQELRAYVDKHKNCEDISMNFLASHLSGQAPLLVEDGSKVDYGTTSGLSLRRTHVSSRSVCLNDIASILGFMSLRNSSETLTRFSYDSTHHQALALAFKWHLPNVTQQAFWPVFHPTQGPMSTVGWEEGVGYVPPDKGGRDILCVKGCNEDDEEDLESNRYGLIDFAAIDPAAAHHSGTTFVFHSPEKIDHRFSILSQIAPFLTWRTDHNCFGPSRILIYNNNLLTTQVSHWSTMVLRALLGPNARPHAPPPWGREGGLETDPMDCLENAVISRHKGGGGCDPMLLPMRRAVQAFCSHTRPVPVLDDRIATVRLAVVGNNASWHALSSLNFDPHQMKSVVENECHKATRGRCQVAVVEGPQEFCAVQVAALGRADIVIGPLGDPLMANAVFLRADTAVLEVVPWATRVPEWTKAKTEMECLDVQYEQLFEKAGLEPLLAWVKKHAERLESAGRREKKEPMALIESCVTRKLRY